MVKLEGAMRAVVLLACLWMSSSAGATLYHIDISGNVIQVDDWLPNGAHVLRDGVHDMPVHIRVKLDTDSALFETGAIGYDAFNRYTSDDPASLDAMVLDGPEFLSSFAVDGRQFSARLEYSLRPDSRQIALILASTVPGPHGSTITGFGFQPRDFTFPFNLFGELNGVLTEVNIGEFTPEESVFHYTSYTYDPGYVVGFDVAFTPTTYVVSTVPEPSSQSLFLVGIGIWCGANIWRRTTRS